MPLGTVRWLALKTFSVALGLCSGEDLAAALEGCVNPVVDSQL